MKKTTKASSQISDLIQEVNAAKNGTGIQSEFSKDLIVHPLFVKTRDLIEEIYRRLPEKYKLLKEFQNTRDRTDSEDNWYKLEALLYFLSTVEEDLKTKEEFNDMTIPVPVGTLVSLTEKLKAEEYKSQALYEKRSVALADLRTVVHQKTQLYKLLHVGGLAILFQATFIFQLIFKKPNWTAAGILAGILALMGLIIAATQKRHSINPKTEQFMDAGFTIGGITAVGYCVFLLIWG